MAEDDTFHPKADATPGQRRKRPPVTIDLEAESSNPSAPVAEPVGEPTATAAPAADTTTQAYEPEASVTETDATDTTEPASSPALARFLVPAVAALGGGIVGGLLVALLSSSTGTDPIASASLDSRFAAMSARLDRIESIDREPAKPGIDPARLTGLEKGLSGLEQEIATLKQAAATPWASAPAGSAPAVDLGPLERRLAALETRPAPSEPAPVDLSPLQSRLDGLTARLDAVEAHPPVDPKTEAAARVIAVTALRQAATGSTPFANELAAVTALGETGASLAALEPIAGAGAPSKADLIAAFPAVAEQIRIADAKVDPGASLIDRLAASAGSLVSVKPSGPMAGNSATAIVSRMEAAVKTGNLAEALREGEALDAIARAPLTDWAAKAGQRITIDTALAGLNAGPSN
jgi:hypothetical protein